jgi:hypothetical protein
MTEGTGNGFIRLLGLVCETNFYSGSDTSLDGDNNRLVALIGYLDSVVAAKQNSDRFGYSVSSNREWVALGEYSAGKSLNLEDVPNPPIQALQTWEDHSYQALYPLMDLSRG